MSKANKILQGKVAIDTENLPANEQRDATLIVPLGRGARGKTLFSRWAIEEAFNLGHAPVVADVDRTNSTLSRFFEGVLAPESADEADVTEFFAGLIEAQAERRFDSLIDLGGGDLVLKKIAREMNLTGWLPTLGIRPVAVHVLGPSPDDLAYLESVEDEALFAPEATLVILNEGVAPPGRSAHAAFAASIVDHPALIKVLERGAKLVVMPRLEPAAEIEAQRLSFLQAAENRGSQNGKPLGLWKAQQTAVWRRRMAESFAPVRGWLL